MILTLESRPTRPGGVSHLNSLLPRVCIFVSLAGIFLFSWDGPSSAAETGRGHEAVEWSERARLATRSLLLDIAAVRDRVVAVGERGHVLLSEDGGSTWRQARVPTRSTLTAVDMVDGRHVWVVGHDTVILYSADAGETWVRQFFAPEAEAPLLDVSFLDANHGLAVGAYGLALETYDRGKTWTRRTISKGDPHLYAITAGRDGTLYVVGESGSAFRSTDRGKTWMPLASPYEGTFFGTLALSDGPLLVFGLRGNLYRSEDGGRSWLRLETGTTASLMSGIELADGTVLIVGLNGIVLVSRDGGSTFSLTNPTGRQGIAAVAEVEAGGLLLAGERGLRLTQSPGKKQSKAKTR